MKTRDMILAELARVGVASPKAIADAIGKSPGTIRQILMVMRGDGLVRVHEPTGGYYAADAPSRRGYIRVPVEASAA